MTHNTRGRSHRPRYLAELYLPGSADDHEKVARWVQEAAALLRYEGRHIRYLNSFAVSDDEMCLLFFEADTVESVDHLATRAGLSFDRVLHVDSREAPR